MATLQENVAKVVAAHSAIKAALEGQGVTVPDGAKLSDMAELVDGLWWKEPDDWPDLKAELAADTESYVGKLFLLYENVAPGTPVTIPSNSSYAKIVFNGETVEKGSTVTLPASVRYAVCKLYGDTKGFVGASRYSIPYTDVYVGEVMSGVVPRWAVANDVTAAIGYTGWHYYNRDNLLAVDGVALDKSNYPKNTAERLTTARRYPKVIASGDCLSLFNGAGEVRTIDMAFSGAVTNASGMFYDCESLVSVPGEIGMSGATNASGMFYRCKRLRAVPAVLDVSSCQSVANMFFQCRSLRRVPAVLDISNAVNVEGMFSGCLILEEVPDVLDTSGCTSTKSMFGDCHYLRGVPAVLDISAATDATSMFYFCRSLRSVPVVLDTSKCTGTANMFSGCACLTAVPDTVDLTACETSANMFYQCSSLTAVPTHLTANGDNNLQISFAHSAAVSKASVESMADNLNDLSGSAKPPTVTLSTATRNLFTADEWTALKAKFTAKGWNISPVS